MNLNEFKEMKNEFAQYIYRYEFFLKCGTINDCYYTNYFSKLLEEIRRYNVENNVLISAIKMVGEEKPIEEIKNYLENSKKGYGVEKEKIKYKNIIAKEVVDTTDKMSEDDKKQFENEYFEYVKNNHPIVKCLTTPEEEKLFHDINRCYKENKYQEFKKILEDNKDLFKEPEYKEEDFVKISAYYYDMKKNINSDYMQKQKSYPYNKQETLQNEISVAREMGDLKAKLNEFKGANKNIHTDFVNIFKNDFSID